MNIYRYFHPDRVDYLEEGNICFTPPDKFNDPFELRPAVGSININDVKMIVKATRNQNTKPSEGLSKREQRKWRNQSEQKLIPEVTKSDGEYRVLIQQQFHEGLSKRFRVLCFSRVYNSLLMGAHYADSHRGFVGAYDTGHSEFQKLGKLEEVAYGQDRPVYNFPLGPNSDPKGYLKKSQEWRYEEEYRIIRQTETCEKRTLGDRTFDCMPLSLSSIKKIYLGARMEKSNCKRIFDLTAKASFKICQVSLAQNEFNLVFDEANLG